MKRAPFGKVRPFAVAMAFATACGASDMASHDRPDPGFINDLAGRSAETTRIGMLTMADLSQPAAVLEESDLDTEKAEAAKKMIADTMTAPARTQANAASQQIAADIMVEPAALGTELSATNPLSPSPLARMAVVLVSDRKDANKKSGAEVVLAENLAATTKFGTSGVTQIEQGLMGNHAQVSIKAPAKGLLTLSQVAERT